MRPSILCLMLACATPAGGEEPTRAKSRAPAGFWDTWGDGQAELAGYKLTQPRYGEAREGIAIHITVTEDFTRGARVKSDGGHGDEYPVVKLNAARDFTTGVYDYNTMSSVFVPLDGSLDWGLVTKLTFSSQEWCGQTWDQWRVEPRQASWTGHSYFDGEADQQKDFDLPEGTVFEDALPLLLRGLAGRSPTPGVPIKVPIIRSMQHHRFSHRPVDIGRATITRSPSNSTRTVPAGSFEVSEFVVAIERGPTVTWWVEEASPRRIIAWSSTDGEAGELTGSFRDPYWQHSANRHVNMRSKLGLPTR